MKKLSAKTKIYVICIAWAVLALAMFLYFFKILDGANSAMMEKYGTLQHTRLLLEAEQDSYQQAKAELAKVTQQPYQPESLFNTDTELVRQLKEVEALGVANNVSLNLSGLSGTIKNAAKAKTQSDLYQIPYSLSISGDFNSVLQTLESLEHMPFVNTINTMSVSGGAGDGVNVSLSAQFYLRKK